MFMKLECIVIGFWLLIIDMDLGLNLPVSSSDVLVLKFKFLNECVILKDPGLNSIVFFILLTDLFGNFVVSAKALKSSKSLGFLPFFISTISLSVFLKSESLSVVFFNLFLSRTLENTLPVYLFEF